MALRAAVSQKVRVLKLQMALLRYQPRYALTLCTFFFRENDHGRTKLAFRSQNLNKSRCQFRRLTDMLIYSMARLVNILALPFSRKDPIKYLLKNGKAGIFTKEKREFGNRHEMEC
jgi:hypothetical protein